METRWEGNRNTDGRETQSGGKQKHSGEESTESRETDWNNEYSML